MSFNLMDSKIFLDLQTAPSPPLPSLPKKKKDKTFSQLYEELPITIGESKLFFRKLPQMVIVKFCTCSYYSYCACNS